MCPEIHNTTLKVKTRDATTDPLQLVEFETVETGLLKLGGLIFLIISPDDLKIMSGLIPMGVEVERLAGQWFHEAGRMIVTVVF